MSFYRRITRERTLSSMRDLDTTDEGLRRSISSFAKSPRKAMFYDNFEIHDDYYSRAGVNSKKKMHMSSNDEDYSDVNSFISSDEDEDEEKWNTKRGRKGFGKSLKEKISKRLFRKRSKSDSSCMSGTNSSYETDSSFTESKLKERLARMEDDRMSESSKRSEKESSKSYSSKGSYWRE